MKIKITGQDKGDLLPISTDLQLLPFPTCLHEHLKGQKLSEVSDEEAANIIVVLSSIGIDVSSIPSNILQKENIGLDFSQGSKIFPYVKNIILISIIPSNIHLTSLNLFGSRLDQTGSSYLSDALKTTSSLAYLKISYNDMGYYGQLELSKGLEKNHSLTSIDFSNNTIMCEEDLSYFFNLCLPNINVAEKIVNRYPLAYDDYVDPNVFNRYSELYSEQNLRSLHPDLFIAIQGHDTIRYFSFGIVTDRDFLTFMHSKMLGAKGQVYQNVFMSDGVMAGFNQLSYLANFKGEVEQLNKSIVANFMASFMQEEYAGHVREVITTPKMIAQYMKLTDLLVSTSDAPIIIDLPIETQEFIENNYLLFLLAHLRKTPGESLLENLHLDVHKNISSYLFTLGKPTIVDVIDYKAQEDETPIMGIGYFDGMVGDFI